MQRRDFLKAGLAAGGLLVSNSVWARVFAAPINDAPGAGAYGDLVTDSTGIMVPDGFEVREIARANTPVGPTTFAYPVFPDGAHVFPDGDGWILVVNSENPPAADFPFLEDVQDLLGGASAIRFDGNGGIVDAYRVLGGTRTNCAGGATPWGTWLSCEEFDETEHVPEGAPAPLAQSPSEAGRVWECDPTGQSEAIVRPLLGHFKHEAAAFDQQGRVYLTEDTDDGCLYRFTPDSSKTPNTPDSLTGGRLDALAADAAGSVSWVGPIDPIAEHQSTRFQAAELGATIFDGGEGCWFAPDGGDGVVYFTTKGDDKVWAHNVGAQSLEVVYPGPNVQENRMLSGVDNIIGSERTGNLYVAEDGGNMEVVVLEPTSAGYAASPLIRFNGLQHGLVEQPNPTPVPLESEVTSITISPDGKRMYFSSQREAVFGATYELRIPDDDPRFF